MTDWHLNQIARFSH